MNFNYQLTNRFKKEFKKISKKHKSLISDFSLLLDELKENPDKGIHLGENVRKVRLKITSKNTGKSGGARIIFEDVFVCINDRNLLFITIYDKSEKGDISDKEIKQILKMHYGKNKE